MKQLLKSGKYVVAVSGGVDSVVLLDMLKHKTGLELIVAHFDHGIRLDSSLDRKFVSQLAQKYGLSFEYEEGNLGKNAGEQVARQARYDFLRKVKKEHNAGAIVTAHHQDDVIETVVINMLRGTGRRGLSSLQSRSDIVRPLLGKTKSSLKQYAQKNNLVWREDSTNSDPSYLRNWVRQNVIPKLTPEQIKYLLEIQASSLRGNEEIEQILDLLGATDSKLKRSIFNELSYKESMEFIAHWLRNNGDRDFDKKLLEKIVIAAKTYKPGTKFTISNTDELWLSKTEISLVKR